MATQQHTLKLVAKLDTSDVQQKLRQLNKASASTSSAGQPASYGQKSFSSAAVGLGGGALSIGQFA